MEKLKLIRENAELFKKHVQDIENLENQKVELGKNEQIHQLNEQNKSQGEAERSAQPPKFPGAKLLSMAWA